MNGSWLDALIRADTGAAPAPTLAHADLAGYPKPVLITEQNTRFKVLSAEIGDLACKLRSRKRADMAAREATLARLEDAKRCRDAVFGKRRASELG